MLVFKTMHPGMPSKTEHERQISLCCSDDPSEIFSTQAKRTRVRAIFKILAGRRQGKAYRRAPDGYRALLRAQGGSRAWAEMLAKRQYIMWHDKKGTAWYSEMHWSDKYRAKRRVGGISEKLLFIQLREGP